MKSKKTVMILSFVVLLLISSILIYVLRPKDQPEKEEEEELIVANELAYDIVNNALQSMIVDPTKDPLLLATPEERFDQIDFEKRFFRPVFDTKVSLYVATLPQRPSTPANNQVSTKPLIFSPTASLYQQTAFIDSSTSPTRWFSIVKDPSITPAKYVWQVGVAPFAGAGKDLLNPGGLLSSGDVAATSSEFSIDFSKALNVTKLSGRLNISQDRLKSFYLIPTLKMGAVPVQKTYYVRVLPVDAEGKVIGDGGTGMAIKYGDPFTLPTNNIIIGINQRFDMLTPRFQGEPGGSGEFPNSFNEVYQKSINSSYESLYYCFVPKNYPVTATSLVLQVTKTPFSGSLWNTVPGLVYQKRINAGEAAFDTLDEDHWLQVDFKSFAPANETLNDNQFITYYVRTVALTPAGQPGVMSAKYSKTVTIQYGRDTTTPVIFENIKVDPHIPEVVSFSYTPIQWEVTNWQYHYVVIRQPLESEIFLGFGSNKPYEPYKVGTKLDFTPQPEDDSWWDDVKNAISDFFSDLTDYLAKITNWVSSTYANLKTGLVKLVADHLPLIPDKWRDELAVVLEGLVDYGLASIGIPPTLPNFDELTEMGTDYLATMAMEAAGIPATDLMKDGMVELGNGISENIGSASNHSTPNPMNWDFVKLDSDYLYRPAYVLITLHNPYNHPTPGGTLSGYNEYIIDSSNQSQSEQYLYARFGGNVYYSTFKVVSGQKVPSLAPGQTLVIPVFLEEMTGKSYWTNGPKVDYQSFRMSYFNLGDYEFNFTINYELPNAYETAKAQNPNAKKEAIYSYSTTGNSVGFKGYPNDAYEWHK
ncbi:MAG: hypothetical protein AB9921_06620 [Erysipelotrichaceae bacterium]